MTTNNFTDKELIEYRKANYWRGFRTCLLITLPIILFLVVVINLLIRNI